MAMSDRENLRESAIRAIANYFHDALYDETKEMLMLDFYRKQGEFFVDVIDKAIAGVKNER